MQSKPSTPIFQTRETLKNTFFFKVKTIAEAKTKLKEMDRKVLPPRFDTTYI